MCPEDKKKETEPFQIHQNQYKAAGIDSTKINMFLDYQLLNGAVAKQIRQATDNK